MLICVGVVLLMLEILILERIYNLIEKLSIANFENYLNARNFELDEKFIYKSIHTKTVVKVYH